MDEHTLELIECHLRALAQIGWIQLIQDSHRHQAFLPPDSTVSNADLAEMYNHEVLDRINNRKQSKEVGH